jgi:hypothetical protein
MIMCVCVCVCVFIIRVSVIGSILRLHMYAYI